MFISQKLANLIAWLNGSSGNNRLSGTAANTSFLYSVGRRTLSQMSPVFHFSFRSPPKGGVKRTEFSANSCPPVSPSVHWTFRVRPDSAEKVDAETEWRILDAAIAGFLLTVSLNSMFWTEFTDKSGCSSRVTLADCLPICLPIQEEKGGKRRKTYIRNAYPIDSKGQKGSS